MAASLLIRNVQTLVTMNAQRDVLSDGYVYAEGARICAIGNGNPPMTADRIVDGQHCVGLPGLVNTHHHLFQTLTRNIPNVQGVGLFQWLTCLYEIWRGLTADAVYYSAAVGMAELLASGCTTTSDHLYLFPQHSENFIDREIQAARDLGIRFQPCRGSMSRGRSQGGLPPDDVVQTEEEIVADSLRLLERYHDPSPHAMTRISLAPCSPFSVGDQLMAKTVELARQWDVSVHTHLAETLDEEAFCLREHGCRPVEYLSRLGWLGQDVWLAHCVHLNDGEIATLGRTGTSVAHCPTSNLRLGSGIAPIRKLLDHGTAVGLGVDGSASNDSSHMLAEVRQALLVHRLTPESQWISADEVLWMATRGGARALGRDDIGSLEVGKSADLVLIDLRKSCYAGALSDPVAAVVFNLSSHPVDLTVVNGRIVFEKGHCVHFNEEDAVREVNRHAAMLLRSATQNTGISYVRTG